MTPALCGGPEACSDLRCEADDFRFGEPAPVGDELGQGRAGEQLHHDEGRAS